MPVIIMSNEINHYGALSTAVAATRGYKVTSYVIFQEISWYMVGEMSPKHKLRVQKELPSTSSSLMFCTLNVSGNNISCILSNNSSKT